MDRDYTITDGKYTCNICGKGPLGKSGYYKHHKTEHTEQEEVITSSKPTFEDLEEETPIMAGEESVSSESPNSDSTVDEDQPATSSTWEDFSIEDTEETTDALPTPLKVVAVKGSALKGKAKLSPKDQAILDETNINLLKMGLTGVDVLISKYGSVVQEDPNWKVNHSDKDKQIVAWGQYEYLKSKGVNPSEFVGNGAVAFALTSWYCIPPVMRANKGAKKKFFKGGLLKKVVLKIPFVGKRLKKRELIKARKMMEGSQ